MKFGHVEMDEHDTPFVGFKKFDMNTLNNYRG